MEKEYSFALLIDTDNVSPKYYDIIVNELEEIGSIKVKRAYGDFIANNPWKEKSIGEGITPIQAFAPIKDKNSTDLVLTIDAMDIFYSELVDAFCIATSDSDFARLAQRLKEGGMYVVIAGEDKTPISLSKSSDKFLMLDKLYEARTPTKSRSEKESVKVEAPSVKTLQNVVRDFIAMSDDAEGWALYATVANQLSKRYPQFNVKAYQAKSKQEFFKSKLGCEFRQEGTVVFVRMKDKK